MVQPDRVPVTRAWTPGLRVATLAALCGLALAGAERDGMASQTGGGATTFQQKARTFHASAPAGVRVHREVNADLELALRRTVPQWPVAAFTVIAEESPSIAWVGTAQGAMRIDRTRQTSAHGGMQYFAGQRWLPDDRVTGIGFEGQATWIETSKGFARIASTPMTLAEKSRVFVERVQARHNRWGLTADSRLTVPGDVASNQMMSSDNDGLWTAMYVAAESFRYAVTKAADARANARTGMQAIVRLEAITGIPGFPARSFIKVGTDVQPTDGEWHDTPDRQWRWKGDTSSDEIVGHYFVYPIYHDLVADDGEKPALRAVIDRITTHILDHGYHLVDVDGKPTRWGWWAPDEIWTDPDETGLRALHMLAHLRVAIHLAGTPATRTRYQAAYSDLITTHRYHLLTRNQKIVVPGSINHSDDELAFLSYYPLLRYETDAALLNVYRQSLERSWLIERPERNPLWNVIYAVGSGTKEWDHAESLRTLHEIPMDTMEWSVRNSHRLDVPFDSLRDRQGRRQALVVLPYDELPMTKWNGNPFNLDGGNAGRGEDDGAYFLLPYWMGRYHRLLGE